MTDREKFLFDLQGFLVVRDFLSSEEVDALNVAVDANQDKIKDDGNSHPVGNLVGEFKRGMFSGMLAWDKPWCLPFNEATIHGTLPWKGEGGRRSLLYRYSPKTLHFAGGTYRTEQPEWVSELTEAQQAVLEPPYIYNRPLIEEDGVSVVRPRRDPI